jgi:hypothetical protein
MSGGFYSYLIPAAISGHGSSKNSLDERKLKIK